MDVVLKVLVIVTHLLLFLFVSFLFNNTSPVDSSRFGSSGNLSQASSQLSETGQESAACSELEESYHSYHSTGYRPSRNGHHPTNGHTSWREDEGLKSSQENGKGISSTIKKEVVSQVDKMPDKTLKG